MRATLCHYSYWQFFRQQNNKSVVFRHHRDASITVTVYWVRIYLRLLFISITIYNSLVIFATQIASVGSAAKKRKLYRFLSYLEQ